MKATVSAAGATFTVPKDAKAGRGWNKVGVLPRFGAEAQLTCWSVGDEDTDPVMVDARWRRGRRTMTVAAVAALTSSRRVTCVLDYGAADGSKGHIEISLR